MGVANPVRRNWGLCCPLSTDQALGFDNISTDAASEEVRRGRGGGDLSSVQQPSEQTAAVSLLNTDCITSDMFRLQQLYVRLQ
jgi:hypothetical protein